MAGHSKKGASLKAIFCFLDESGFSERPTVRRTWGMRGQTPIIQSSGSWKNISATGIVATDPRLKKPRELCMFKRGSIRKEDTLNTLKHLARHIKGTIALLWDGLAQHRSKIVKEYLKKHKDRFVVVERFPAYAPELNPQEYLWASSKTRDMANFCSRKFEEFELEAKKSIRRIQRSKNVIRGALYKSSLFKREGVK